MNRFPRPVGLLMAALTAALFATSPAFVEAQAQPQVRVDEAGDPLPVGTKYRLGTTRLREVVRYGTAALSPDGTTIASQWPNGIRLLDVATGKEIKTIGRNILGGGMMQYSADGKFLAASNFQEYRVISVATGEVVATINPRNVGRNVMILSGDGERLAVVGGEQVNINKPQILVWDVSKNKEIATVPMALDFNGAAKVTMSVDGKTLAFVESQRRAFGAANDRSVIKIWDIDANKESRSLEGTDNVSALALSADGKLLAATTSGSTISVWTVDDGIPFGHFAGRSRTFVAQLAFSPDNKRLAVMNNDGHAQIWTLAGNDRVISEDRPVDRVYGMQFTKDGDLIGFGADGVAAVVWDVATGKLRTTATAGHTQPVSALCFTKDGKSLISGGGDTLIFWDVATGKRTDQKSFATENRRVSPLTVTISPDGNFLSLVNSFSQNQIFDIATGKVVGLFDWRSFNNLYGSNTAFSADGSLIANMDAPGVVRLWSVSTGRALHSFLEHNHQIDDVAISPDGSLVAVACRPANPVPGGVAGGIARSSKTDIFDTRTGKAVREVETKGNIGFARRIVFSPDSTLLAETRGNAIMLIDVSAGREVGQFNVAGTPSVGNAPPTFSPDGRLLAVASQVFTIKAGASTPQFTIDVYEVASRTLRLSLTGHDTIVRSMKFSPDSQVLASSGNDASILLWELNKPADPKNAPTPEEVEAAWNELKLAPGEAAHRAMMMLAAQPAVAIEWAKENLKPVERVKAEGVNIEQLIDKLGDESFLARERANAQLVKLGVTALPALKKALTRGELNTEATRRAELLVSQVVDVEIPADRLQPLRAVEILERIGSNEARAVLQALAAGEPSSYLAREAKAALKRAAP